MDYTQDDDQHSITRQEAEDLFFAQHLAEQRAYLQAAEERDYERVCAAVAFVRLMREQQTMRRVAARRVAEVLKAGAGPGGGMSRGRVAALLARFHAAEAVAEAEGLLLNEARRIVSEAMDQCR